MSNYPFAAIVGADEMALALVLTTVSPEVGGVLVRGEKGTAKSTMVRALAENGVCRGWRDVRIVRGIVGTWDQADQSVLPLI